MSDRARLLSEIDFLKSLLTDKQRAQYEAHKNPVPDPEPAPEEAAEAE